MVGAEQVEVLRLGGRSYPYTTQLQQLFNNDLSKGMRQLVQAVSHCL